MTRNSLRCAISISCISILSVACSTLPDKELPDATSPASETLAAANNPDGRSQCQILYDAGSFRTRLYIYQDAGDGWIEHEGPQVSALADPIRGTRGKTFEDAQTVVNEIAGALPAMLSDGPVSDGEPAWKGFDWQNRCEIAAASVFATAGMRIAEQAEREKSAQAWSMLKDALQEIVGADVPVQARTLSGFEEGLFAWLALAEREGRTDFGIAEMGGASAQIVYPCENCDKSLDAVRSVRVNGQALQIFSYSYLGLGTDEAYRSLGFPMSCRYGIGQIEPDWSAEKCADRIQLTTAGAQLYDPYNFAETGFGGYTPVPTDNAPVDDWYLTGGFAFMNDTDISDYCEAKNGSFDPENGCFRVVYLRKYLDVMGLADEPTSRSSWTLGAALCEAEDCLAMASPEPACRWSPDGCL